MDNQITHFVIKESMDYKMLNFNKWIKTNKEFKNRICKLIICNKIVKYKKKCWNKKKLDRLQINSSCLNLIEKNKSLFQTWTNQINNKRFHYNNLFRTTSKIKWIPLSKIFQKLKQLFQIRNKMINLKFHQTKCQK